MASVGAERGQQAVAGVLQHLAVVGLDHRGTARQRAVHHGMDLLGVEVLRKRRRADHVEEEDADLAQGLGRLGGWCRGQVEELGTQGRDRRIDHRVTQQRALSFQRGDAGEELLMLGRHKHEHINVRRICVRANGASFSGAKDRIGED